VPVTASKQPDTADSAMTDVVTIERELRRLLRRARAYSVELARSVHPDLEPAVYALLVDILTKSPARAADLAEDLGVTKGVVSRQVRSLERLGLVERGPDSSDARAHILVVTPAGRRAVRRAQAARREAVERLLRSCDPDELAGMAAALSRINELLS
jgi:DNA-binding MarR family transcriptional regulator